jgi:hypothetical protein
MPEEAQETGHFLHGWLLLLALSSKVDKLKSTNKSSGERGRERDAQMICLWIQLLFVLLKNMHTICWFQRRLIPIEYWHCSAHHQAASQCPPCSLIAMPLALCPTNPIRNRQSASLYCKQRYKICLCGTWDCEGLTMQQEERKTHSVLMLGSTLEA